MKHAHLFFMFSENDRVVQVNAIPMEGANHSFAVGTLRKCGKVAKIVSKNSLNSILVHLLFEHFIIMLFRCNTGLLSCKHEIVILCTLRMQLFYCVIN